MATVKPRLDAMRVARTLLPVRIDARAPSDGLIGTARILFPYNVPDYLGRIFLPGVFSESIGRWAAGLAPVQHLWQHDCWQPPLGPVLSLDDTPDGLAAVVGFSDTDPAREMWTLLGDGAITTYSISWIPEAVARVGEWQAKSGDYEHQIKGQLLDLSPVNYGGMPGVKVLRDYLETDGAGYVIARERAVPSHGGRTEDTDDWPDAEALERGRRWASSDGSGDPDTIDFDRYETLFAVVEGDANNLTSYKFQHHDIDDDGPFVSRAGVIQKWILARGGRSGQPNEDAQRHLKRHREQFGLGDDDATLARPATADRRRRLALLSMRIPKSTTEVKNGRKSKE